MARRGGGIALAACCRFAPSVAICQAAQLWPPGAPLMASLACQEVFRYQPRLRHALSMDPSPDELAGFITSAGLSEQARFQPRLRQALAWTQVLTN